jgi:hypothetical protein
LDHLGRDEAISHSPAWFSLLGRLARPDRAAIADAVFARLGAAFAGIPTAKRWSALAAVKSGADIDELDALVAALEPPRSGRADRWINALTHLNRSERKQLAAATTARQRRDILAAADLRLARQVGGRYGVIAVFEVCDRVPTRPPGAPPDSSPSMRCSPPQRITMQLPPLQLEAEEEGDAYRVLHKNVELGRGIRRADLPRGSRIASSPDAYVFRLIDPQPDWLGPEGWGWPAYSVDPSQPTPAPARATGPIVLPGNRRVLTEPRPETMTLSLTDYLRSALARSKVADSSGLSGGTDAGSDASGIAGESDPPTTTGEAGATTAAENASIMAPEMIPDPFQITLRYAAFGSYYGVGVSRPPSDSPVRDAPHLLNLMLILEKLDTDSVP